MSSDNLSQQTYLCVTCGEFKPGERFAIGDCTCDDCHDEGQTGVYYDLDEDTGAAVARRCDMCKKPLAEHGKARLDNRRVFLCPEVRGR